MAPRIIDLTGRQFHELTVIGPTGRRHHTYAVWLCQCSCGTLMSVPAPYLRKGARRSCGCVKTPRNGRIGREHNVWMDMRNRCTNPKNRRYYRYGARGIKVCERWNSFVLFMEDMGPCPIGHSIDRKDNDGDYEPTNCRWADDTQQLRNFSRNRMLTFNGETKCLSAWAEHAGIHGTLLSYRLKAGWSMERALTTPVKNRDHKPTPTTCPPQTGSTQGQR